MIVVDASALIELLLRTKLGKRLEERLLGPTALLNAPHLIDTEVLQVLRRLVIKKELTVAQADAAVADLGGLDVVRHGHEELSGRVWELRHNLGAYGATYLALAESLDATLVTGDRRFLKVPGRDARVELWK
jgi:predicted nucleic acid-binding protein